MWQDSPIRLSSLRKLIEEQCPNVEARCHAGKSILARQIALSRKSMQGRHADQYLPVKAMPNLVSSKQPANFLSSHRRNFACVRPIFQSRGWYDVSKGSADKVQTRNRNNSAVQMM
jgi:hypothetical protein